MRLHRLVETFEAESQRCAGLAPLFTLALNAAQELGFDRLAMVHGLWFRRRDAGLIRLDNFGDYADLFISRRYYRDDPALLACQRTSLAFSWDRIGEILPLGDRQHQILREAARHGLRSGISLPINVLGEPPGCCSFGSARDSRPGRWPCRAAALIGAMAFERARHLCGFPRMAAALPPISPRKLEVLRFAAIGKTDPEIALILGLSRMTIETYMGQLRQAFDVYSRTQLCVTALRLGLIAFDDAISGF